MKSEKNNLRTIFWNVDTQYDFMRSDESFKGALPVPNARSIEENLSRLTRIAKNYNIKVINTADWHNYQSKEFSDHPDYITTFPPHCIQGTTGAKYVPATNPEDPYVIDWQQPFFPNPERLLKTRNIILYKDDFDIFAGNSHTGDVLKLINPDKVIVYGVATNVCVNYAVLGLLKRNIKVFVPVDAIKELSNLSLEETLNGWKYQNNKVDIIQTKDVEKILGEY